ncbi:MAG: SH3 domain-containing protein [Solibacillus sp.]
MKGFLTSVFGLLLLLAPLPVLAAASFFYVVSPDGVELTTTASMDGKVLANLPQGMKLTVVAEEEEWTRIDFNGRLGWVPSASVKPFTENLWPVYAQHYATIAQTEHVVYALIADFTRDGVEDLYIVTDEDTAAGNYTESIYHGHEVIYQKSLTDGLMILQDGLQYFIRHDATINSEAAFSLMALNDQAKADYYDASAGDESYKIKTNSYVQTIHILQPALDAAAEKTFISEEITSKDYSGAELVNAYNESVYLQRRAERVNGAEQELTDAEYNALFAPYNKAKTVAKIYDDNYKSAALSTKFSFNKQRVLDELIALGEAYQTVVETELSDAELQTLRDKLAQSVVLELPFSEGERLPQMFIKNMLQLMAQQTARSGEVSFDQELVMANIRAFYGVKPEEQLEIADVKLVDEQYVTNVSAPELNSYRQLTNVQKLTKDFVAVQFTEYELPQTIIVTESEKELIAGNVTQEGYVIFKHVADEWLYIDTVKVLDGLNMLRYEDYANQLMAKEVAPVEKALDAELVAKVEEEPLPVEEKKQPVAASLFILIFALILSFGLGYAFYAYKYKRAK